LSGNQVFEVKMLDDKMAEIKLIRRADGEVLGIAHPYGQLSRAVSSLPPQQMSPADFEQLVAAAPQDVGASSSGYTTGASIGYNPAGNVGGIKVGATGGECFNFTTTEPSSSIVSSQFNTTSSIHSFSEALNVSASATASYEGFNASDSFSYSDNFQSSANSGAAYFSASAVYELNNTVDTTDTENVATTTALNDHGKQQSDEGTFGLNCGSSFMATVYGGMQVTGRLSWASSSKEQAEKFSNTFSASDAGLADLSTSVSEATSVENSSFSCGFTLEVKGGGPFAGQIVSALGTPTNTTLLESCCKGTSSDCGTWATNINAAIVGRKNPDGSGTLGGVPGFDEAVDGINWHSGPVVVSDSGPDLGHWWLFPDGIPGVVGSGTLKTDPVSGLNIMDLDTTNPLGDYTDKLQYQLKLLNQLRMLMNQADHLHTALTEANTSYVPSILPLDQWLKKLKTQYELDAGDPGNLKDYSLLYGLKQCMDNPSTGCDDLLSSETSAYDFYGDRSIPRAFFFQQNTIALQYQGITTSPSNYTWPSDVIYMDVLPQFTGFSDFMPIAGQAAFLSFVDAPFFDGRTETTARVNILPLHQNSDLSEIYSTESGEGVFLTTMDGTSPGLYFGIKDSDNAGDGTNKSQMAWLTDPCEPMFDGDPCGIDYQIEFGIEFHPKGFKGDQIGDFFTSAGSTASPHLSSGRAESGGRLQLRAEFPLSKTIDLRSASMSIHHLLLERSLNGAGGKGELVSDAQGGTITPIVLAPRPGATSRQALFETPMGAEPQLQGSLKIGKQRRGPEKKTKNDRVARVRVRLRDGGHIAAPSACTENGATAYLALRIVIGNGTDGAPLTLITRDPWECQTRSNGRLVLRAQTGTSAPPGNPFGLVEPTRAQFQ
jgi:hypothetical protein